MSAKENKAIVRRWNEAINTRDVKVLDELASSNYVLHTPGGARGLEDLKRSMPTARSAFPDVRITIEDEVAEGDKVVVRYTIRGTHKGEFMGIAPTGKLVTWTGTSIYRIENGRIAEDWFNHDNLGMMQQLGAIPKMG
jgi:steroid delta-isomerase-like uncharacterized protein